MEHSRELHRGPRPTGNTQPAFQSPFTELQGFAFQPNLVVGFLHRPAKDEESIPTTEVLYGSHHVSVDDENKSLFFFLMKHTNAKSINDTL